MGSCYSGDRNAEDHMHTNRRTSNIEDAQQKYRLGTASNRSLGEGMGRGQRVSLDSNRRPVPLQWFRTFCLNEAFITPQ